MSTSAQYASIPRVGSTTISIADLSYTAPTTVGTILAAGASGTRIDYIDIQGLASTTNAIVNLFIFDGTNYSLWNQVPVLGITSSATSTAFSAALSSNGNSNIMPLTLPSGSSLRATVTANQVAYNPTIAGVSTSASVSSAAFATLNGTLFGSGSGGTGLAASTTAIAAAATVSSAYFTLTTIPYVMTNPARVSLTSAGNQSAITFTIRGLDATGTEISETLAGPNATTVFSANIYAVVTSVYSSATMTGTTSVGYSNTAVFPIPARITQVSGATSNTGVTWVITGIDNDGTLITENLTGAGIGLSVTSTNTYRVIASIQATVAGATAASFGNPVVLSGVRVTAYGGDF